MFTSVFLYKGIYWLLHTRIDAITSGLISVDTIVSVYTGIDVVFNGFITRTNRIG